MYEYDGGSRVDAAEHDIECDCHACAAEDAAMQREMAAARAGVEDDGRLAYRVVA